MFIHIRFLCVCVTLQLLLLMCTKTLMNQLKHCCCTLCNIVESTSKQYFCCWKKMFFHFYKRLQLPLYNNVFLSGLAVLIISLSSSPTFTILSTGDAEGLYLQRNQFDLQLQRNQKQIFWLASETLIIGCFEKLHVGHRPRISFICEGGEVWQIFLLYFFSLFVCLFIYLR